MKPLSQLILVLASGLFLAGCGGDQHDDLRKWMAESSKDMKGKLEPLPELKPFPIITYEAKDRLDPFSAGRIEPEKAEAGGGKKPDFDRPKEELEKFALENLNFIGILNQSKSKNRYALIQANNGVVYKAVMGNYLGQNFGRIVDITESEVVLIETVKDPTGQTKDWIERQSTLQLQEGVKGK